MKPALALALACLSSCKKTPAAPDASAEAPSAMRAISPPGGCAASLTDAVAPCKGMLGGKLDKYVWTVTKAGAWEVTVGQPSQAGAFRPVLIVWKEPDVVLAQDDVAAFGGQAHAAITVEPGSYRVSVIAGSKEPAPPGGWPYTLAIARK